MGHRVTRLGGKVQRAQDVAGQPTSLSDQELTQRMTLGPAILGCPWARMDM